MWTGLHLRKHINHRLCQFLFGNFWPGCFFSGMLPSCHLLNAQAEVILDVFNITVRDILPLGWCAQIVLFAYMQIFSKTQNKKQVVTNVSNIPSLY